MFAALLAGLAVVIALQALRVASRPQIVVQVMPESISRNLGPQLPHFVQQAGSLPALPAPEPRPLSLPVLSRGSQTEFVRASLDVHRN